ncbi:MAG: hypothetical protein FD165_1221 [Gammaproteobacteria bacterium]|nr:MAG: hypothetical protein FD165_1221 [Gammaproteobacteria bacterium]TND07380.1 MAG: hypothetical protein FD120_118 [Gammaproteobacteria bacterium]
MKKSLIALTVTGLTLAGCGGGSSSSAVSSGSVTGLQMPSSMSVVSAQDSQSTAVVIASTFASGALFDAAGTEYTTDPVRAWVWDASLEPMQQVNEILCYMDQTGASDMVNLGAYTALIDEEKCKQGQNTSSDTGQSSGQSTKLQLWTIESTRASNSAPQLVKLWVPPTNSEGDTQNVLVEVTAYEGVSASKPFGSFKMTFKGVDQITSDQTMLGSLFTVDANTDPANANANGDPQFKLIMSGTESGGGGGGGTFQNATNVVFDDASGTAGQARTKSGFTPTGQSFSMGSDFAVAFNATHFLRHGEATDQNGNPLGATDVCTDRNDFNSTVWRYNVYHSDNATAGKTPGNRVAINSGFPVTAGGEHGWIGYWGLWFPGDVDISTLTTVTRETFGSNVQTVYDLVQAPGKLIKSTKDTMLLTEIDGTTFNYWDNNTGTDYVVEYSVDNTLADGTVVAGAGFWKTGRIVRTQNGQTVSTDLDNNPATGNPAPDDAPIDATPASGQFLGMWSQALGGQMSYVGGAASITFFAQEFINTNTAITEMFNVTNDPDQDGIVELKCYQRCLKGNISQADLDDVTPPLATYLADSNDPNVPAQVYKFKKADLTLYMNDGTTPVKLATGVTPQAGSPNQWGINSDAMVLASASVANVWETWQANTSYRWETGDNSWNKTFAVKEQGTTTFVQFDKPIQIKLTFDATKDANAGGNFAGTANYNRTFVLDYSGDGNLFGIPWLEPAPGQEANFRWSPAFTLADGSVMGSSNEYVVKAIEKEQQMRDVNVSNCSTLTVPTSTQLPLPTTAEIGTVSITMADKPTVTDAPAVIEGELQ